MKNKQMDMTLFHELLWDESADDQLMVVLRKMLLIEEPESVVEVLGGFSLGVWSGWAM